VQLHARVTIRVPPGCYAGVRQTKLETLSRALRRASGVDWAVVHEVRGLSFPEGVLRVSWQREGGCSGRLLLRMQRAA